VRRTSSLCSHCQTQACRQRMLFCFSEQCVDLFQLACPAGLQRTRLSALSVNLHTPAESYGVSRYKQWKAIMHQWHAITHPDTFEHLAQLALPDLRRHDNLFMYSGDHKIHTRPYSPSSPCAACSVGSQMARQGPVSSSPCGACLCVTAARSAFTSWVFTGLLWSDLHCKIVLSDCYAALL